MYCKKCGKELSSTDQFCANCGAKIEDNNPVVNNNGKKSSNTKLIVAIILAACILCGVFFAGGYLGKKDNVNDENTTDTSVMTEESTSEETSEVETVATTSQTTTKVTESTTIDAGKLYRPSSDKFCDQYTRYISGYFEGQGYAKMRFGPSKNKYNVVGQIDNGNVVTVQTQSIDGWTLIYYEGTEGWVRTDFLFKTYEECFPATAVQPDGTYGSYPAYVDVTGEYDGEPLNMRSGPSRDYKLITTVPDGAEVEVLGFSEKNDEWTYVSYNGKSGWVLSKYVFLCETGDKPVLYLYPEKEMDIDVKVELKDMRFTCTYPEYNQGWSVHAKPDGTLINKADGKEYSYLYWELGGKQNYDFSKGFVVKGSDTAEFLQETLAEIGLTPEEYNEFIVYWLPKMQKNPYNLISFQYEEYTDNVVLDITPQPDSVLRVFMAYKPLDSYIEIEPQSFDGFERKGFTVVEWGGVEVK